MTKATLPDGNTIVNSALNANELHKRLIDGVDFKIPEVDWSKLKLPDMDELSKTPPKIDLDALTTRQFKGKGVFDALMESVYNHINEEFKAGRMTANEYTKVYTSVVDASMTNAVQFLLQKDSAYWNGVTAQMQAITAVVQLEIAKAELVRVKFEALTQEAQFANMKIQTLNGEANYNIAEYNLNQILPANKELITEQTNVQLAQTSDTRKDQAMVKGLVGKNKELYSAQIKAYANDAEYKITKLHTDVWVSMRSTDEGMSPPKNFTNDNIGKVVDSATSKVGL